MNSLTSDSVSGKGVCLFTCSFTWCSIGQNQIMLFPALVLLLAGVEAEGSEFESEGTEAKSEIVPRGV